MEQAITNSSKIYVENDYKNIDSRIKAFCADHSQGQILTEIVKDELGHVIFKAHAVVDGLIRGTGHAHELEGASNINDTSHYEACETTAVGRALAFLGYCNAGSLTSYEETENAKLQQSQISAHKQTLEIATTYISKAYQQAISNENEEQIEECQRAMMGNDKLRERVNATLSDAHVAFLVARGKRIRDERKAYEEKRRADIIESRHIIEQKYGRKH